MGHFYAPTLFLCFSSSDALRQKQRHVLQLSSFSFSSTMATVPSAEDIFQAFTHSPKPIQSINVTTLLDLHNDLSVNARKTPCPFSINGWLWTVLGIHQYHADFPFEAGTCTVPPAPGPIPAGNHLDFPERNEMRPRYVCRYLADERFNR